MGVADGTGVGVATKTGQPGEASVSLPKQPSTMRLVDERVARLIVAGDLRLKRLKPLYRDCRERQSQVLEELSQHRGAVAAFRRGIAPEMHMVLAQSSVKVRLDLAKAPSAMDHVFLASSMLRNLVAGSAPARSRQPSLVPSICSSLVSAGLADCSSLDLRGGCTPEMLHCLLLHLGVLSRSDEIAQDILAVPGAAVALSNLAFGRHPFFKAEASGRHSFFKAEGAACLAAECATVARWVLCEPASNRLRPLFKTALPPWRFLQSPAKPSTLRIFHLNVLSDADALNAQPHCVITARTRFAGHGDEASQARRVHHLPRRDPEAHQERQVQRAGPRDARRRPVEGD